MHKMSVKLAEPEARAVTRRWGMAE